MKDIIHTECCIFLNNHTKYSTKWSKNIFHIILDKQIDNTP